MPRRRFLRSSTTKTSSRTNNNNNKLDDSRHKTDLMLDDLPEAHPLSSVDDSQRTGSTEVTDVTSSSVSEDDEQASGELQPTTTATTSPEAVSTPIRTIKSCLSVGSNLDSLDRSWNTSKTKDHLRRNVSFHTIDIREHPIALSDHPGVSKGPAIGLDWFPSNNQHSSSSSSYKEHSYPLEDYERNKPPPRTRHEMLLPVRVRESLLQTEAGVSALQLRQHTRDIRRVQEQRRRTAAMGSDAPAVLMERAKRKFQRFVRKTTNEREQEDLWKRAAEYEPRHSSVVVRRSVSMPAMVATRDTEKTLLSHEDDMMESVTNGTAQVTVDNNNDDEEWAVTYQSD